MSVKGSITTADYLDFDEYKRLVVELEEDKHYRYSLYCVLAFCLGLRISDVLKLKWEDILDRKNVLVTEKKTGKARSIPIGIKTAQHIKRAYEQLGWPDVKQYVFVSHDRNKPITRQAVNKRLKEWKVEYGLNIKNFSSHTFRKTFGRYVYESMGRSDEALIILNRIFRHTSIQTTMVYIGLRDDEISKVFNNLDI